MDGGSYWCERKKIHLQRWFCGISWLFRGLPLETLWGKGGEFSSSIIFCNISFITWDNIGHASPWLLGLSRLFNGWRPERLRDNSKSIKILSAGKNILICSRNKLLFLLAYPRFEPPSWRISRLRYCDLVWCSFQWNQTTMRWSRVSKAYHFLKKLANCVDSMLFHCFYDA